MLDLVNGNPKDALKRLEYVNLLFERYISRTPNSDSNETEHPN